MRVLVLGGSGMLGHKMFQVLNRRFEAFATFRDTERQWMRYPIYQDCHHTLGGVDAINFETVVRAFAHVMPDVAINCIGIVKQLPAASDPLVAVSVNSLFPHRLAALCAATGVRMIHLSTDCVFSGRQGNYTEEDIPDPEDFYGRSKLLGEVNQAGCLTIRTSIIGRDLAKQIGLLEWFLSQIGGRVRGYVNVIYTGLTTQSLAGIVGDLIDQHPQLYGLYHISSEPISKYDLLVKIRDAMGLDIKIDPYEDKYCDRSLNSARFRQATGYRIPTWDEMIFELVQDPTPYDTWRKQHAAV